MSRIVVVSTGTDHHQFDRLMGWLGQWLPTQEDTELWVQHGSSVPVPGGRNVGFLDYGTLQDWFATADVVVLQGGPGGIVEALRHGHIPVAVPRLARLGEVVDDHQVAFVRRMSDQGLVRSAESSDELAAALADPALVRQAGVDLANKIGGGGVTSSAEVLNDVASAAPPRRFWPRFRAVWGRSLKPSDSAGSSR